MQTVRSGPAVTASADGQSILVAGGFAGGKALDSVEIFDVRGDSWRTDVAPMNMTRSYACAAVLDGAWHVVGGNSEMRPYSEVVSPQPGVQGAGMGLGGSWRPNRSLMVHGALMGSVCLVVSVCDAENLVRG